MTPPPNIFEKEVERETIFKNRDVLLPSYVPEMLPFRDKEIQKVMTLLAPALKKKKPNNLFIYGKTGTGKTCVTKYVVEQLNEIKNKYNIKISSLHLNCRMHNSKYQVLVRCLKALESSENLLGFSASHLYDKMLEKIEENQGLFLVILDEVDLVKDVDDLIYALTRANDDLTAGYISIIGISNSVFFKKKLDPRSKSSLCEEELVFPPYNADQLKEILKQRAEIGFKRGKVSASAITLAAAFSAQESGDARYALKLLLRAGDLAEKKTEQVSEELVKKARRLVEEDIVYELIDTLPEQQQLVLYAISQLSLEGSKYTTLVEEVAHERLLFSGEVYDRYEKLCKKYSRKERSARWFREYLNDLEMLGLITTTTSGKGIRGNTRLIKLAFPAKNILKILEKKFE